ncbi:MAG: type II secretion system protein GspG, partial [Armatimonadetes bacterium]|nr:type II secretion system protein GspG [Armatimonadota bacterium]
MRRWVGVTGALVFLLVAWAGYKVWQSSPSREVQQELARLKRMGEPTKLSDLLPPVPLSQDGTLFYRYAITQLEMAEKKLPRLIWDSVYEFISSRPNQTLNLADVQKTLQEVRPALQTLRKALSYPHMRMTDWSVENPMTITFPHFSKFREFARLLVAEGKWRKQQGDVDGAVESHLTALKLVRRMGDEPSGVIGFLVQGAIFTISINGLRQILSDVDASPQSYRAILSELLAWDIDRDFAKAVQSERVFTIIACDWMKRKASRKLLNKVTNMSGYPPFQVNLAIWLKSKNAMIAQNELKSLKYYEAVLSLIREGVPYDWKKLNQLEEQWQREVSRPAQGLNLGGVHLVWDENSVAKLLVPSFPQAFLKAANFHALQRLTQVAIALRLYRRENGRYPETLQELVPQYLPSVPLDPFDGKPLRYERLRNGFKIWSIGQDFK